MDDIRVNDVGPRKNEGSLQADEQCGAKRAVLGERMSARSERTNTNLCLDFWLFYTVELRTVNVYDGPQKVAYGWKWYNTILLHEKIYISTSIVIKEFFHLSMRIMLVSMVVTEGAHCRSKQ